MASPSTEKSTKDKKNDKDGAQGAAPKESSKDMSKQDVAGKPVQTREELLLLHRKSAAQKDVVTSDVVGYWNSDSDLPISGFPEISVVAIDSSIDPRKPSLLMKWKVTLPTEISNSEGVSDICKAGDLVGVWFKPGMRDVRDRGGIEVTMARDPSKDKDTGKGNPMKAYTIYANGIGQPLRITEDRREKSKTAETVFDVKQMPPVNAPRNAPSLYDGEDKLAF